MVLRPAVEHFVKWHLLCMANSGLLGPWNTLVAELLYIFIFSHKSNVDRTSLGFYCEIPWYCLFLYSNMLIMDSKRKQKTGGGGQNKPLSSTSSLPNFYATKTRKLNLGLFYTKLRLRKIIDFLKKFHSISE